MLQPTGARKECSQLYSRLENNILVMHLSPFVLSFVANTCALALASHMTDSLSKQQALLHSIPK